MAAPRLEGRGDGFVAVAWEPVEGAEKYAVEMRGTSPRWAGVGLFNGTSVKKKNLKGKESYHFRVKPLGIGKRVFQPLSPPIHQSMPLTKSHETHDMRRHRRRRVGVVPGQRGPLAADARAAHPDAVGLGAGGERRHDRAGGSAGWQSRRCVDRSIDLLID